MAQQKSGTLTQGAATDARQKVALFKPTRVLSLELSFLATQQTDSLSDLFQTVKPGRCSLGLMLLLVFSLYRICCPAHLLTTSFLPLKS